MLYTYYSRFEIAPLRYILTPF